MRWSEIINVNESASGGSTGAGSIATVSGNGKSLKGAIGAGFDPNGDFGIYPKPNIKKKNKKSSIIKRN